MTELNRIFDAWPVLRDKGPDAWAAFARMLLDKGKGAEAFTLALAAHDHPDCSNRDRRIANGVLNAGVPKWHWNLVQDTARNAAYEAALARWAMACEMNPFSGCTAAGLARINGVADRPRITPRKSNELILALRRLYPG